MIFSLPTLLSRIADRLSGDVLPQLPNASWPASHVRSALVLLAYAKKMLEEGPDFIAGEIAEMRLLLDEAKTTLEENGIKSGISEKIDDVLARPVTGTSIGQLQSCLEAHQDALNAAIDLAHDGTLSTGLSDRIRHYLKGSAERERSVFGNVIEMMPL